MIYAELFMGFVVVSLLAFGGGQAALPLIERLAVHDARWITASAFGTAVAFGYVTPGPVLITATFVGFQVAGLGGALTATAGVFAAPWALATMTAQQVNRLHDRPWLRRFGAGAAPAVVGLLGVTALALARDAVGASWVHLVIVGVVLLLGALTRVHPVALLALGGALGWVVGA